MMLRIIRLNQDFQDFQDFQDWLFAFGVVVYRCPGRVIKMVFNHGLNSSSPRNQSVLFFKLNLALMVKIFAIHREFGKS